MSEKRYVQYKNDPNGTKWEVLTECAIDWQVRAVPNGTHYLPKSDYIICTPPARWRDVTAECEKASDPGMQCVVMHNGCAINWSDGYRLRKVQLYLARPDSDNNCTRWAFIVEKRED